MKLYTLAYSANTPTRQQVNVPTNTDYMVGVKIEKNGRLLDLSPSDVTLDGLSADIEMTNGYVTFTNAAGDNASMTSRTLSVNYTPLSAEEIKTFRNTTPAVRTTSARIALSANTEFLNKKLSIFDFYSCVIGTLPISAETITSADVENGFSCAFWPLKPARGEPYTIIIGSIDGTGSAYVAPTIEYDNALRTNPTFN